MILRGRRAAPGQTIVPALAISGAAHDLLRVTAPLTALERLARQYGPGVGDQKVALLTRLASASLPNAAAVRRLHEALCWLRAYPDSPEVLWTVESLLAGFARRRDLRRHARALDDSGIAGTAIQYPFYTGMARWLAAHWPERLPRSSAHPKEQR